MMEGVLLPHLRGAVRKVPRFAGCKLGRRIQQPVYALRWSAAGSLSDAHREGSGTGNGIDTRFLQFTSQGGLAWQGESASEVAEATKQLPHVIQVECPDLSSSVPLPPGKIEDVLEGVSNGLETVEAFVDPNVLAQALVRSGAPKMQVHVAGLLNGLWHKLPSDMLGSRPYWLSIVSKSKENDKSVVPLPGWEFADLVALAAKVGLDKVQSALREPSFVEALASLSHPGFPISDAIVHASAALGLDRQDVVILCDEEVRRTFAQSPCRDWGRGLAALQHQSTPSGLKYLVGCSDSKHTTELLQLEKMPFGGDALEGRCQLAITPPSRMPPLPDEGRYQFPDSVASKLREWYKFGKQYPRRSSKGLYLPNWGKFDIRCALERWQSREGLRLPTPRSLTSEGYTMRLFPEVDRFAAASIAKHFEKPDSHVAQYIVRWKERLNGPAAARTDELEGIDLSLKHEQELPPETHFKRLEEQRAIQGVQFRECPWLRGEEASGSPRMLGPQTEVPGNVFLLLTDTHQMALAGRRLKNCVGNEIYFKEVLSQKCLLVALSTSTSLHDAQFLGKWDGKWSEIRGSCNRVASKLDQDMFEQVTSAVRCIWEAPVKKMLEEAMQSKDVVALQTAISRAQEAQLPQGCIADASQALREQNSTTTLESKLGLGTLLLNATGAQRQVPLARFAESVTSVRERVRRDGMVRMSELGQLLINEEPRLFAKQNFCGGTLTQVVQRLPPDFAVCVDRHGIVRLP